MHIKDKRRDLCHYLTYILGSLWNKTIGKTDSHTLYFTLRNNGTNLFVGE
jgi:hypothetical protein